MFQKRAHWVLLLIAAGALGVRLYRITERSFWFDEAFSWSLACRFPVAEMVARTGRDVHPPLYYLLLGGWAELFGESVLALRSLSVLLGVLTVVGLYGFCREAYRERPRSVAIGLVAAALVAASAIHIRFSWETRMYTLGTALAVFSSWLLLRNLRRLPLCGGPPPRPSPSLADARGGRENELADARGGRENEHTDARGGRENEHTDARGGRENELADARGGRENRLDPHPQPLARGERGERRQLYFPPPFVGGGKGGGPQCPASSTTPVEIQPRPAERLPRSKDHHLPLLWIAYALLATALVYTHNYGLFLVAAQVVFLFLCLVWDAEGSAERLLRDRRAWWGLAACAGIAVAYLPWLPVLLEQTAQVKADYWIAPLDRWRVPNSWFQLFVPSDGWRVPRAGVVGLSVLLVALLAASVWRGSRGEWLVFTLATVPTALPVLVSLTTVSIVESRHFLFSYLFLLCAVTGVLFRYLGRPESWIVAAVLLGDQTFVFYHYWHELGIGSRPGVRGAVEFVLQQRQPGEPVVARHPCLYFSVMYYMRAAGANDAPRLYLPEGKTAHYTGGPILTQADCAGENYLNEQRARRVWMIDTTGFTMGFTRPVLPAGWKPTGAAERFRDVYWFQGEVVVSAFRWTEN